MPLNEINFITGNRNKLAEVEAILGGSISLKSQSLDLTEIQGTVEEISVDKCRRAAEIVGIVSLKPAISMSTDTPLRKKVGGSVLTEDTCLCFNALKGLPGPYMCVSPLH